MSHLGVDQWVLVVANSAIVTGYTFIALRVAPLLPVRLPSLVGAFTFFWLCALTHTDLIVHTLFTPDDTWGHISREDYMLLIHVPQAVAVWVFALGFLSDLRMLRRKAEEGRDD